MKVTESKLALEKILKLSRKLRKELTGLTEWLASTDAELTRRSSVDGVPSDLDAELAWAQVRNPSARSRRGLGTNRLPSPPPVRPRGDAEAAAAAAGGGGPGPGPQGPAAGPRGPGGRQGQPAALQLDRRDVPGGGVAQPAAGGSQN